MINIPTFADVIRRVYFVCFMNIVCDGYAREDAASRPERAHTDENFKAINELSIVCLTNPPGKAGYFFCIPDLENQPFASG